MLTAIAVKSFCALALAAMLTALLRRNTAATRHLVWTLAVVVVLAMPALIALAPRLAVTVDDGSALAYLIPAARPAAPAVSGGSEPTAGVFSGPVVSAVRARRVGADPAPSRSAAAIGNETTRGDGGALRDDTSHRTGAPGFEPDAGRGAGAPGFELDAGRGSGAPGFELGAGGGAGAFPVTGSDVVVDADVLTDAASRFPAGTLAAIWLAGALLVLGALTIERLRLAAIARHALRCASGPLADAFVDLCREAGLSSAPRPPRLLIGRAGTMPMTWGSLRPVVMLPAEAQQWGRRRTEAVLRHELAHVRRRDDLAQLAATVMTALHWFDPLAWLALRRLRIERELACDDAVLRRGERPSAYAAELLHIAGAYRTPARTGLAVQSIARPSQLRRRLLAVLEESRDRRALTRRRVVVATLLAGVLALPVAALGFTAVPEGAAGALQVSECWAPNVERNARSMSNSDERQRTLEWESDNCTAELRLRGELSFNDDFTAVTGISSDGSFLLVHREGGVERRLEILPGAGGTVQRTWRIDGRELPFDADAERWFGGILVQILRASGIAAEERTAAIYRAQGVEGVYREIGLIPGNSARGLYLIALLEQAELDDGELTRLLGIAAGDIDSNSTRGRVLEAVGRRYRERILGGTIGDAYWQAVAGIDSNSTTARLLESLVEGTPQGDPMVARVLEQAAVLIDSNSTLASLLRRLHQQYPEILTHQPEATLFWQTAASIDSNSTINSFLLDVSNGAPVDSGLLPLIFDTAQARISSNSVLAGFVLAIEQRYPEIGVSGPLTDEFWATVERVDSSSTLSSLLLELTSGKPEDSAMLDRVLDAADRIDSSSQRGRFLLSFALQHQDAARGRLRDRILGMANGIDSRSTRERTLRDLGDLGIG